MQSSLEATLTRNWLRRGWLAWSLLPISLFFRLLVGLRRRLYASGCLRSGRLPVPVVVVGNIFIGGTGKTPFTIWLVETLRRAGFRPGVISRGHGSKADLPRMVERDSLAQSVGDEPLLIAQRAQCPVMVGRDRLAAGRALLAARPEIDIIISDDGLQHYGLQRQVEIVLFDARGVGNGWLLPAGPLREPAARPRDFTVLNRPNGQDWQNQPKSAEALRHPRSGQFAAMHLRGEIAERLADPCQRVALQSLAAEGGKIVAAAGIGNPARFFDMLRAAGLRFTEMPLPDHYDFARDPFTTSVAIAADIILITEKDAVKCRQIENLRTNPSLWVVPVTARIDGALAEQIVEKCRGYPLT